MAAQDLSKINEMIYMYLGRALEDYQNEKVDAITPKKADHYLTYFSGVSAGLDLDIGKLERKRAMFEAEKLIGGMTKAKAKALWEAQEEGQQFIKLKYTQSSIKTIIAACKYRLQRLRDEANNKY